jgi:hypothetical protein
LPFSGKAPETSFFAFIQNCKRGRVRCKGLILIQASSAAMCGGKVAVIKHFTPKEEAGDELLHPTA